MELRDLKTYMAHCLITDYRVMPQSGGGWFIEVDVERVEGPLRLLTARGDLRVFKSLDTAVKTLDSAITSGRNQQRCYVNWG